MKEKGKVLDEMLNYVNGGKISEDGYVDLFLYILDCNEEGWDVDKAISFFTECWNAGCQFENHEMDGTIEDYQAAVDFIRRNYNETDFLRKV